MTPALAIAFWSLASLTTIGVPLYGWRARGRSYAIFVLVVLGLSLPGALITHARLVSVVPPAITVWLDAAFAYSMAAAGLHLAGLVAARLRSPLFRLGVSIPGMTFLAAGALCGTWLLLWLPVTAVLRLLGHSQAVAALRTLDVIPLGIAVVSVLTSVRPVREIVRLPLARHGPPAIARVPLERHRWRRPPPPARRPLRVVQIADPHLGPWQPVAKLRRHLGELLRHQPDLVVLTGDFLTMEGAGTPGALAEALAPLETVAGRCIAIFGNHDHAYPGEVRHALSSIGATLLVDDELVMETPVGPVQIIGADYVGRGRRAHLHDLLGRFPRRDGCLRILLLHDPLGFRHVAPGEVDLTISGHTHGGQLGLVSLGLDWTVLSHSPWPDHGLFAHGASRLYVHRGTGFYGFPLRIGVPGEASLLEVLPP